jgi:hypothetical protein
MVVAGIVVAIMGGGAGGAYAAAVLIGGGLLVASIAWALRVSFAEQDERAREERARRYFARHGRWPRGT